MASARSTSASYRSSGGRSRGGDGTTPRRRADAERNITAVLDATQRLLAAGRMPSMSEIAAEAGIGRVTLYGHFSSREEVLDAVIRRAIDETEALLAEADLAADPADVALEQLVHATWPVLDRMRAVRTVAVSELGPEVIRDRHDPVMAHVDALLGRGRDAGMFRTDLPRTWLVSTFYAVIHAAADEVTAGRLDAEAAPDVIVATLSGAFRPAQR